MGVQLPYIIGIAGPSCSGKSWLAERLRKDLGKLAGRLSLDDFYLDRSHLPVVERGNCNFDHPAAIDWALLEQTLVHFTAGKRAQAPLYDFKTHCRRPEVRDLQPLPIIIMDGLWLFHHETIRRWFQLKIYIHAEVELCSQRRVARDTSERGRTEEQALKQFWGAVAPMQEEYVLPQAKWADMTLNAPVSEEAIHRLTLLGQNVLSQKPSKL
ncbi:MAG: uridine kinase family protein [Verrucomicrobiales bacterium]